MNREIKYRDCIVSQASNNHVMICKDSEMVFHAEVDFYLDVLLPSIDESEVTNE